MKIEGPSGPSKTQYTGKVSGPRKTTGTSGASFADQMTGPEETSAASATSGISSVNQLMGLQEVDDPTQGRKQARQYGGHILDQLDELRLQILEGRISKAGLISLARSIAARRAATTDPQVIEILDEIDLRAQVEIAKFMRDQDEARQG